MSQTSEARAGTAQPIAPVRMAIAVSCSAEAAFAFFVGRFADWWPLAKHSVSAMRDGREPASIVLEGRVGGRIYETDDTGAAIPWGTVTALEPGQRLVLSWHPGSDPATPTEVEFRFVPTGADTCRVELEHRDWHRLGDGARAIRDSYEAGWVYVIGELERALKAG